MRRRSTSIRSESTRAARQGEAAAMDEGGDDGEPAGTARAAALIPVWMRRHAGLRACRVLALSYGRFFLLCVARAEAPR